MDEAQDLSFPGHSEELESRRAHYGEDCRAGSERRRVAGRHRQARLSSYIETLLCTPHAGRRGRSAHHPGSSGTRQARRYDGLSAFVTPTPAGCSQSAGSHRGIQARRSKALQEADEAMSRPTLEVADIVRAAGNSFWEQQQSHLAWPHRKALDAIVRCRTAALGGHRDQCVRCGHQAISFNSCGNRHCPKCQGNARAKWLAARSAELLPVPYFHVVFTSAAALIDLGADIGLLSVIHTGDRTYSIILMSTALFRPEVWHS